MKFPLSDRRLTLKETDKNQFILLASTPSVVDEITRIRTNKEIPKEDIDRFPFIMSVDMCGSLNEVKVSYCEEMIEHTKHNKTQEKKYKCYSGYQSIPQSNNTIHEDALSSFKCACNFLQTNHFIVLKLNKNVDLELEELKKEIAELEAKKIQFKNDATREQHNVSDTIGDTEVHSESPNE